MKKFTSFYTYPNFTLDDASVGHKIKLDLDAKKLRQVIYEYQSENGWMLKISADGLLQFSHDKIEEEIEEIEESWKGDLTNAKSIASSWSKYLDICNAIHLCFECCMHRNELNFFSFEFKTVSYGDIARVTYDSDNLPIRQTSYRSGGINTLMRHGDYLPDEIEKVAIPKSAIDYLCIYYLESMLQDDLTLQLAVKVGQSLSDHNISNWSSSVITSWFVTEWYLGKLWDDFVDSKSITGNRKKRMSGVNYTTSIIIEHLQLHKIIDDSKYETINKLRKKRNDIAHKFIDTDATKQDSIEGLDLCKWVLMETTGLEFTFFGHGFPQHGL